MDELLKSEITPNELTYDNATHLIDCAHAIGRNRREYQMRCHVLGKTKSGKVKVLVFGDRDWKGSDRLSRIRYVFPYRISKL